ncbi:PREDICTED: uncharacterized protein LOC104813274 [Tarenaya hassleriana]|uniref:uncharacterized protein LOC104813274 n=1 Tax=Tarenaya hassleriana TaxID=28532 RepID=UPI00053C5D6E|nr:PREDICTED: uncharacterized protein LOC104813274 [Tarenaya hassleriana]
MRLVIASSSPENHTDDLFPAGGFLKPGFFVTLLFLVNVSVDKSNPRISSAIAFIFLSCLPISALQLFVLVFPRLEDWLPKIFYRSSVVVKNPTNEVETVLCAFPLLGTMVFAVFGAVYSVVFVLSCWKLMSLVINKALRIRIYVLTMAVLVTLPVEIVFLGLSVLWKPERASSEISAFVAFLSMLICAVAGQDILVIRPITDSLTAETDGLWWSTRQPEDRQESAV